MPLKIVLENYSLWIEYIFSIDVLTPIFFFEFPYNYLLDHSKEYNLFAFLPSVSFFISKYNSSSKHITKA